MIRPSFAWARQVAELALLIDRWEVCVVDLGRPFSALETDWHEVLDHQSLVTVEAPIDCYLADPFLLECDGQFVLLAEAFDFHQSKGRIDAFRLDQGIWERVGVALERPWHLSFPFPITHEGEIYVVPESSAADEIALYRLDQELRLERVCTLVEDFAGVDPVLMQSGGRWVMLVTDGDVELGNSALHLFTAPRLTGPWTSAGLQLHDTAMARSAGAMLGNEDDLLRPSQDCTRRYGEAVVLSTVSQLSATSVELTRRTELLGPEGAVGLHTVNCHGNLVTFDALYKQSVFKRPAFWAHKLRKLAAKMTQPATNAGRSWVVTGRSGGK